MALTEYQHKRKFDITPEPSGTVARKRGHSFCVQKHAASHLHYDFRLELDGVLKSWAVPKGPCLDPAVKRLAMHVEDHPVSYGDFEGTIPKGQYGGGTVMLWDRGQWEPVGDAAAGYKTGRLKFTLHGEKLQGGWMLLRTARDGDRRQWLLFKEKDDASRPLDDGDVLETKPLSVKSGRDLDEIAMATGRPQSNRTKPPATVRMQLATLAKEPPVGDEWLHEIKYDGYRMLGRVERGRARFISRNDQDWTSRLKPLAVALAKLPVNQAIFDGEVVALRPDGTTHFQDLQNAFKASRSADLHYFIFDLLHLDGTASAMQPLEDRKAALAKLLGRSRTPPAIHYSEHIEGDGPAFLQQACRSGLEGIISKRREAAYQPGRGLTWLKIKCTKAEEFVIGGYTDPAGSRRGFGALLVGTHDAKGALHYAGRIGTGFDDDTLATLSKRLKALAQSDSPFADFKLAGRTTHWVEPSLVAQVKYASLTDEGILRHASFEGLREDKPANEVVKENAVATKRTAQRAKVSPSHDAQKQQYAGVRLTSPDKILYPDAGITKLELAKYYEATAEWILPHLVDRPLVLVRCPEGQAGECFYQKHPAAGTPENLRRIPIREKTKTEEYVVVDDIRALISLAQIGTLEIHAWGSRADKLDHPDRLIFDLDPDPEVSWSRVVQAARQVRDFLGELGLESFLKTTGGKGLHLVVPIERRHDWSEAKAFCKRVAELIVAADPGNFVATMSKVARRGKIFIDYLRNDRGATAIIPYSPRAKPGAPVSVPLAWNELSTRLHSDHFTVRNLVKRLNSSRHDPWASLPSLKQRLSQPLKLLADFKRR